MSPQTLVLLGPPGAGKGTQAARLRADLALHYLSTGELLRRHVRECTLLGVEAGGHMAEGRLVPDALVNAMLLDELAAVPDERVLLDGFPRTLDQADVLDAALAGSGRRLDAALLLHVPDEDVIARISGRLQCPRGHVYHTPEHPPRRPGVCDEDGARLVRRHDDHPDTVRRRLAVYHRETRPLITYYSQQDVLHRIDGTRPADEVYERIHQVLAAHAHVKP
jgi:adenylate kinase